jgi:hypothetical protein
MKRFRKIIHALLFALLLASSTIFAQSASYWKQSNSENFHIISNAADTDSARIAGELEDFRRSFFTLFKRNQLKSPIPTRILIFKSDADSANINLSQNRFQVGQDANYIVVSLNKSETDLRPVYHQYFHYLLSNHIGKSKIPTWLNEGLAGVYENFQTDALLKTISQNSDQTKHELLKQSKFLPAEILLNTDYYSLNQQQNHGIGVFDAQAFAIVSYLIQQSSDEEFKRFVGLISSGMPLNEALIKSFKLDLLTVEKNLKSFIDAKSNENIPTAKIQDSKTLDLKFSPISQAETESYFGDFLYQSNDYDAAALHLLKSLSLNPLTSFPRSTLGLVKLRQYKSDEAFQDLDKSLEYKDVNYLTHYRYAYALSRQGMTEYGFVSNYDAETAGKIYEFLEKSIELNPEFDEAYNLYAFVGFVRNEEIDKSMSFVAKVLANSPGNEQFLLRKAELDMRKENFTQARKNAADVYQNAENAGLRLYAQNTLDRINSTEYQLLQSHRYEKLPYSDAISEKPFSDEEIARRRAKAMRESITAALRQPASDEKRIFGNIVGIDCRRDQVDFTVKTDDKIIMLYAESFETLQLTTFNAALSKPQIGCGTANSENAVIIYRNLKNLKPDVSGEIVSVEFVPKEFTLSVNY